MSHFSNDFHSVTNDYHSKDSNNIEKVHVLPNKENHLEDFDVNDCLVADDINFSPPSNLGLPICITTNVDVIANVAIVHVTTNVIATTLTTTIVPNVPTILEPIAMVLANLEQHTTNGFGNFEGSITNENLQVSSTTLPIRNNLQVTTTKPSILGRPIGLGSKKKILHEIKIDSKNDPRSVSNPNQQPQIVGAKSVGRPMRKLKKEFLLNQLMLIPTFVFFTDNKGCRYVAITSMSSLVFFVHKAKCTLNLSNINVFTPNIIMLICFVF
jgi:hypothetical protein